MENIFTKEKIENNKQCFIDLIKRIDREGADIERLIRQLEKSDFFVAPASQMYHNSCEGGLCDHSLNVYDRLVEMCKTLYTSYKVVKNEQTGEEEEVEVYSCPFSDTTLIIVALFHDICKMNFYEKTYKNKKVYYEGGSKTDELGNYDWESVPSYAKKESKDRFVFGNHGQTSEYMIRQFIPLTTEESVAIINHMGGMDNDSARGSNLSEIYGRFSLAVLLHSADLLATYITEAF